MKDKTATLLRILLAVLLVISAVLFVLFYSTGEEFTNTVMTWAYILLALTTAITIIFPIMHFIFNPKKGKAVIIGLIGFTILYLISYSIAGGSIQGDVYEKFAISEGISRFIGAILYMTYILGGLAILAIFYASISRMFK